MSPVRSDAVPQIRVHLDEVLESRGMSLGELSRRTGISTVNLGKMKNGHGRAVWFTTLAEICAVLGCQPGDLLSYSPVKEESAAEA